MLNYIWCGMIIFSIICSFFTGSTSQLSSAILSSAAEAVELLITMCGTICLWSGLIAIADSSGASAAVSKVLSPLLSRLFPDLDKRGNAFKAICANVTANLLGLGNAATPLGLKAMNELERLNPSPPGEKRASRDMIMFVILNTSSIQLMPTMIVSILSACGSENPTSIVPCVWISSLFALAISVTAASLFSKGSARAF